MKRRLMSERVRGRKREDRIDLMSHRIELINRGIEEVDEG